MTEQKPDGHEHIQDNFPAPAYPVAQEAVGEHTDTGSDEGSVNRFKFEPLDWQSFMRCVVTSEGRKIDFFDGRADAKREAIKLCGGCIVRPECLMQDIATPKLADGIVAGLPKNKRTSLKADPEGQLRTVIKDMKKDRDALIQKTPDGYWTKPKK